MKPCESKGMLCMTCRACEEGLMPATLNEEQKYLLWAREDSTDHDQPTLLLIRGLFDEGHHRSVRASGPSL